MVATPTREPGSDEGWRVIAAAVAAAHHRLGEGLASAYAIGSLAHGGFSPAASDVDLALLTTADGAIEMASLADAIGSEVRARVSGELAKRLSVFHAPWPRFRSPPPGARFPPIDRQDLVRCGLLVHGDDLRARFAALPTDAEITEQAIESALRRHTPEQLAEEISELSQTTSPVRLASKLVLWPIRLLHVADTATATGNHDAVEHYRAIPSATHVALADRALTWRATGRVDGRDTAAAPLTTELFALHHQIFERLSRHQRLPRTAELADRAARFAAWVTG